MPILYATADNLTKKSESRSYDIFSMDIQEWYDKEYYISLHDYTKVNTLDYLNLVDKKEDIISIFIINEQKINLNQIVKLKNLQHLKLESIENITFCDLNTSLKYLEVNYCALNYPPVVPDGLVILDISMNLISSLEKITLPSSLKIINLNDNHFRKFPILPDNIEILYICSNYLKEINNLPKNLTQLFIRNNYIKNNILSNINNIYIDIKNELNQLNSLTNC